jgi:hypothetical protein
MTIDATAPPDQRLFEITHFATRTYNKFEEVWLRLPVLPTHLPFPADYRTREEIERQAMETRRSTEGGQTV